MDVISGAFNSVNNGNPRLYAVDIECTNATSTITNINLSWNSASNSGGVAAILAVSGVGSPEWLTITQTEGQVILNWPFGQLLQATNIGRPWIPNPDAAPPYKPATDGSSRFYRVEGKQIFPALWILPPRS